MERREFIGLSTAAMASAFGAKPSVLQAATTLNDTGKANPEKKLNPNTQWLGQAKWGFFAHYLAHTAAQKLKMK